MSAHSQKLVNKIVRGLRSRYPLYYLLGWEEERMERLLSVIVNSPMGEGRPLIGWSAALGFDNADAESPVLDPAEALRTIARAQTPAIYLMKDLPAFFDGNPALVRAVRDLYYRLKNRGSYVFFSHPVLKLPDVLKKELFLVEMDLPTEEEILEQLSHYLKKNPRSEKPPGELLHRLAVAMKGLSLTEVGHLMARLFGREALELETAVAEIQEEKSQILRKEGCLEYYPIHHSLEDVGGLEVLKEWVMTRRGLFTEKAFEEGVPLPSGILFMGVSGCGKSMAAKAIAAAWHLPLVRLDMSLVLSGSYGPPEAAFAHATRMAEEIAPIVLWIDEVENAFGYDEWSNGGGNVNIFSSFLTWMQEKPSSVFLAATANRIQQIPAELMRKGRFDQLFFLDLPTKSERKRIFAIHIATNGGDISKFDVGYLAALTKGWNGAEIEQAVKSARVDAYQEGREFTVKDVSRNTVSVVPLSRTMREQIQAIKDWSYQRAVPASKPDDEP